MWNLISAEILLLRVRETFGMPHLQNWMKSKFLWGNRNLSHSNDLINLYKNTDSAIFLKACQKRENLSSSAFQCVSIISENIFHKKEKRSMSWCIISKAPLINHKLSYPFFFYFFLLHGNTSWGRAKGGCYWSMMERRRWPPSGGSFSFSKQYRPLDANE